MSFSLPSCWHAHRIGLLFFIKVSSICILGPHLFQTQKLREEKEKKGKNCIAENSPATPISFWGGGPAEIERLSCRLVQTVYTHSHIGKRPDSQNQQGPFLEIVLPYPLLQMRARGSKSFSLLTQRFSSFSL